MASSPPLSSPWRPLPLYLTPATLEPPYPAPASTSASASPRRGAAPPTAVCFLGLIPSVQFRSNGSDRGYRFAHVCFPGLIIPPSNLDRTARTPSDPLGPLPPSDLDRTARTPSDPCSHPFPPWRWTRSVSALFPSVADTPGPRISARPPARSPSAADLISAVGF
jgi:hypothetical protein